MSRLSTSVYCQWRGGSCKNKTSDATHLCHHHKGDKTYLRPRADGTRVNEILCQGQPQRAESVNQIKALANHIRPHITVTNSPEGKQTLQMTKAFSPETGEAVLWGNQWFQIADGTHQQMPDGTILQRVGAELTVHSPASEELQKQNQINALECRNALWQYRAASTGIIGKKTLYVNSMSSILALADFATQYKQLGDIEFSAIGKNKEDAVITFTMTGEYEGMETTTSYSYRLSPRPVINTSGDLNYLYYLENGTRTNYIEMIPEPVNMEDITPEEREVHRQALISMSHMLSQARNARLKNPNENTDGWEIPVGFNELPLSG